MTGQTVSHYRIIEKLGQGGMGEVWKAEDTRLGRLVALKFLKSRYTQRFEREARAISALNHPNICTLYDVGEHKGEPYLVMEYIEGERPVGPLPLETLLDYAVQMSAALEAAHAKSIIHRDIKPANILVTREGQVKVLDFGLAKRELHRDLVSPEDATLTQGPTAANVIVGTLAYMSPEQMRGEELDTRTDIYSLGAVLHELATGTRPFQPDSKPVPAELQPVIGKALEQDREKRYQTASALRADLRQLQKDTASRFSAAPPRGVPSRHWAWVAVVVVVLLASAVSLWLWRIRATPPATKSNALAVMYFTNLSQDKSLDWLDRGLCEMLTTNLSQIKGMDVLSTERVANILGRMGKKEMNAEVAPDVARNAGAAAFVTGALMRTGATKLRLDVRVQDAASGQVLLSEKVEGENLDAIFKMVDALTARLAERFLPSNIASGKSPALEEIATSNVEAFHHYQQGLDAFRRFEMREAAKEFEEAVRLDPKFALAWLQIANAYYNLGEYRKTTAVSQKLLGMETRLPRKAQLSLQGARALDGYDWDGVERAFQAVVAESPLDITALGWLAMSHWVRDRFDRAAFVFEEALKLDPKVPDSWNMVSFMHIGTGNVAKALEANDRFRALLPNDANPPLNRGDLLYIACQTTEAIQEYEKALKLDPAAMGGWSHLALSWVYRDQRKFAQAESALREYSTLSRDSLILFYQAHLEEARGRLEAARDLYRKAVAIHVREQRFDAAAQALLAFARVSVVLGETAPALAFARQQKLAGEEHQPVSFLQAAAGDLSASEQSLEQYAASCRWLTPAGAQTFRSRNQLVAAIHRQDPNAVPVPGPRLPWLPETWNPLYEARAALLRRDYGSAEHLLRRTLLLQRFNVMGQMHLLSPLAATLSHFYLGQVYEATGKRDQSLAEYKEFLSAFERPNERLPQIAEARAALKRLAAP